jgi:hypothetical protein
MNRQTGKYLAKAACVAIATLTLMSAAASAAEPCANGATRNWRGKCVESDLSSSMRQRAIEMSQPKISETAAPVSPAQDRNIPKTSDLNRYELSNKGNFSTNPSPPSH